MQLDMADFFASVRRAPFGGTLTQDQVDGINALIAAAPAGADARWIAYVLATAWWETGRTMQPVPEVGRGRGRRYGKPGRNGGQIAYGRGHVQLTWDDNYERADRELGLGGRLIRDYDLALDPAISARIIWRGMTEGWFTGKALSRYFNPSVTDWIGARRIVNGTDRAGEIAAAARQFHAALLAAREPDATRQTPAAPPIVPAPEPVPDDSGRRMSVGLAILIGLGLAAVLVVNLWK